MTCVIFTQNPTDSNYIDADKLSEMKRQADLLGFELTFESVPLPSSVEQDPPSMP